MNQYRIYENQLGMREAVKQGWSWPACCFTWIWAFNKKINRIGAITLGIMFVWFIVIGAIESSLEDDDARTAEVWGSWNNLANAAGFDGAGEAPEETSPFLTFLTFAGLAFPIVFGLKGNRWREDNLLSRAYVFKGDVAAGTDEAALGIYISKQQGNAGSLNNSTE